MNYAGGFRKCSPCSNACRRAEIDPEQGWALVSVLLLVAMLSLMVAAMQALLLISAQGGQRIWERQRADALFEAALTRSVLGISDPRIDQRWSVYGVKRTFQFEGTAIEISVQDELGLIDLNAADGSVISRLLETADVSPATSRTLTERIVSWRSTVGLAPPEGATNADYEAAGLTYYPRRGSFQTVDEIRLVLGMTPDIFRRIEPALTVYSGRPAVDTDVAPDIVKQAIYSGTSAQSRALLQERRSAPTLRPTLGHSFGVDAAFSLNGHRYQRRAVILLTGDPKRPYLTQLWQ